MKNKLITVFTPTFNRGYCILNLYESLVSQTSSNFKWLIIDDGSSDNTEYIVKEIINENKIDIEYIYQENAGKHVAHNNAVKICKTELFFCVDSDDILPKDSIQIIENEWCKVQGTNNISGIVGYKAYKNGKIVGNVFPEGMDYSGLSQLYEKGKVGDTALIYRTCILSQYPFPSYKDERFLRESLAYDLIDEKYKLKVCSSKLYMCEYLEDGLSKNATKLEFKSPQGAAHFRLHEYKKAKTYMNKIRNLSAYILFSLKAGKIDDMINEIGILRIILLMPLTLVGYLRYKIILKKRS